MKNKKCNKKVFTILTQAADNVKPAALYMEVFDSSCVAVLLTNVTDDDAEEEEEEERERNPAEDILNQLEKIICPAYCSSRGNCVNGTCQCNEGKTLLVFRYNN